LKFKSIAFFELSWILQKKSRDLKPDFLHGHIRR